MTILRQKQRAAGVKGGKFAAAPEDKPTSKGVAPVTPEEEAEAEDEEEQTAEGDMPEEEAADPAEEEAAEGEEKPAVPAAKATGERARISAILKSAEAKGREGLAEHLALDTGLSVKSALGILKAAPKASAGGDNAFRKTLAANSPRVSADTGVAAAADAEKALIAAASALDFVATKK